MKGVSGLYSLAVSAIDDGGDQREAEVADLAKKAAQAASSRRKRSRENPSGITAADVDDDALAALDSELEQIATWAPGFAGAMLFRGAEVLPLVSLITSAEREAMRRALMRTATLVRSEMEMIDSDALGAFVDSVTSTTKGAILSIVLEDDILVVALEGRPVKLADAWNAIATRRAPIQSALTGLINAS